MSWVFDPKQRRVARCIETDHPQWHVTWGVYSRIYCAFPLFHSPPGTIVRSPDARELIALMREAEIEFGPQRSPRIPGSRRLPPARQHDAGLERLVPYEPGAPASYEPEASASYEPGESETDEPEWPASEDPESWPSEELAFLPSEAEIDWPEEDEAAAGMVTRGRRHGRYRAARRGQW
jgi:hypothetical protein